MANSPLISIRIPPETLARIDQLAQKRYPPRRTGKKANRSQVILDAIEQFLDQYELQESIVAEVTTEVDSNLASPSELLRSTQISADEQLVTRSNSNYQIIHTVKADQPREFNWPDESTSHEIDRSQMADPLPENPSDPKVSSTRTYIDWWLDYFSYVGKLTKPWFISKR